jgi:hypothetical protein
LEVIEVEAVFIAVQQNGAEKLSNLPVTKLPEDQHIEQAIFIGRSAEKAKWPAVVNAATYENERATHRRPTFHFHR